MNGILQTKQTASCYSTIDLEKEPTHVEVSISKCDLFIPFSVKHLTNAFKYQASQRIKSWCFYCESHPGFVTSQCASLRMLVKLSWLFRTSEFTLLQCRRLSLSGSCRC